MILGSQPASFKQPDYKAKSGSLEFEIDLAYASETWKTNVFSLRSPLISQIALSQNFVVSRSKTP